MSKTKRALPEDIDITENVDDYSPAERAHDEEQARAEMQLWDASKNLQGKLWMGTVVLDFDTSTARYVAAIASDTKPTPKEVLKAICETTNHDFDNLEFAYSNKSKTLVVSAWSEPLAITPRPEIVETEVPF